VCSHTVLQCQPAQTRGAGGTGRRDDGAWQRSQARIFWSDGSYNCAGGRFVIGCQDGTHAAELLQGSCWCGQAVHTSRTHRCLSTGWDAGRVWGHTDNAAGVTLQGRMAAIVLGNTGDAQKLLYMQRHLVTRLRLHACGRLPSVRCRLPLTCCCTTLLSWWRSRWRGRGGSGGFHRITCSSMLDLLQ